MFYLLAYLLKTSLLYSISPRGLDLINSSRSALLRYISRCAVPCWVG